MVIVKIEQQTHIVQQQKRVVLHAENHLLLFIHLYIIHVNKQYLQL